MPMFTNRRLLTHAHTRSITPKRSCVTTSYRASVPWDEAGTDCRSRVRHFAPHNRGTTTAWRTNRTAACGKISTSTHAWPVYTILWRRVLATTRTRGHRACRYRNRHARECVRRRMTPPPRVSRCPPIVPVGGPLGPGWSATTDTDAGVSHAGSGPVRRGAVGVLRRPSTWVLAAGRAGRPPVVVHDRVEGLAGAPAVTFQVRCVVQVVDRAQAQPCYRPDVFRDA